MGSWNILDLIKLVMQYIFLALEAFEVPQFQHLKTRSKVPARHLGEIFRQCNLSHNNVLACEIGL